MAGPRRYPSLAVAVALRSGILVAVAGWVLVAVFGLFPFGGSASLGARLGALGFGLGFLYFPFFMPVAAVVAVAVGVRMVRADPPATRAAPGPVIGAAVLMLALASGAATGLLELRGGLSRRAAEASDRRLADFRAGRLGVELAGARQDGERVVLTLRFPGNLPGRYQLRVVVLDGTAIWQDSTDLAVAGARPDSTVAIALDALRAGYRRARMGGSTAPALVDPLEFEVRAELRLLESSPPGRAEWLAPESPERRSVATTRLRVGLGRL